MDGHPCQEQQKQDFYLFHLPVYFWDSQNKSQKSNILQSVCAVVFKIVMYAINKESLRMCHIKKSQRRHRNQV